MRLSIIPILFLAVAAENVKITVDRAVKCDRKTKIGDTIFVHYKGSLQDGNKQFDSSYDRGEPLKFVLGGGMVIKGWDENLRDMCIHEKRTLVIPPEFGYGSRAMSLIPANSTLIFETELMGIKGVENPETFIEENSHTETKKVADSVKSAISSGLAGVTEAGKVILSDTDEGGQDHDEL